MAGPLRRWGATKSSMPRLRGEPVIRPIRTWRTGDRRNVSVILGGVFAPFSYAFVQRGVLEVLLLSAGAGVLGTWAVMRGLAFYSHAVAAAAFPGLVLAAGLGFAPLLGAMGTGAAFAAGVGRLSVRRRERYDALTALALVGALAAGTVLASNVFHSGAEVDSLLFGSLFAVGPGDLALGAAVSLAALAASLVLGPRWLAVGFDP